MTKSRNLKKVLVYVIAAFIYIYVSTSLLLFHGPFSALTSYFVDSLATTRHAYLLRPLSLYTLSNAEIDQHSIGWTSSRTAPPTFTMRDFSHIADESIQTFNVSGSTFTANVMLIRNPERVKVAITKNLGSVGETVSQMVADNHAVAGINAGAFEDTGWRGTGGIPMGITMHDGEFLKNDASQWGTYPVIGITADGQLVCGNYSVAQVKAMNVQEAVSFGPVLVQGGKGMIQGVGDGGYAPRTAIGQRADGTIIFIVTDGRLIHGANDLGASFEDIQNLMLQLGAVTAANLDGGSSTTMVYNGQLVNEPTDVLGSRLVATSFVVTGN